MKLRTTTRCENNVLYNWSTLFEGPIDLDTSSVRYFQDIHKSLITPRTYEEIKACMDRPDDDFSLIDP